MSKNMEMDWQRAKKIIFVVYAFMLALSTYAGLISKNIPVFVALFVAFSILIRFMYSRVKCAESNAELTLAPVNLKAQVTFF